MSYTPFSSSPYGFGTTSYQPFALPFGSSYSAPAVPSPGVTGATPATGESWWQRVVGAVGDFIGFQLRRARDDASRVFGAGTTAAENEARQIWIEQQATRRYMTYGLVALVVLLLVVLLLRRR